MALSDFKYDGNVAHAQAFGCWLYVQFGYRALFFGSRCSRGIRIVAKPGKRLKFSRVEFI